MLQNTRPKSERPGAEGGPLVALLCLILMLMLPGLLGACASGDKPRPVSPELDLHDPDPTRRTQAIQRVASRGERRYVPELIDLLDDRDEAVRLLAGGALSDLTGRESNYRAFAPRAERLIEIEAWRSWYAERGPRAEKERETP